MQLMFNISYKLEIHSFSMGKRQNEDLEKGLCIVLRILLQSIIYILSEYFFITLNLMLIKIITANEWKKCDYFYFSWLKIFLRVFQSNFNLFSFKLRLRINCLDKIN